MRGRTVRRRGRLMRRVLGSLAALAVLALALPAAGQAATAITTVGEWNGNSEFHYFGAGATQTYGQVITAPAGVQRLSRFTFYVKLPTELVFRAFVYEWTGEKAAGSALYEGPDMHTSNASEFEAVTANTGGIPVTPGKQYVLFFSVSHDQALDEPLGGTYGSWAGEIPAGVYSEGEWVFVNSQYGTAEAEWLSSPWFGFAGGSYNVTPSAKDESTAFSVVFDAVPQISSVSPSTVGSGGEVQISGEFFTGATEVLFGSTPATSFHVASDEQITATVPASVTGKLAVRVIAPGGASALTPADEVTVVKPPSATITTPASGATYTLDQVVDAEYACADGTGGPGIASCVGSVSDGAPIDTLTLGMHTFTVIAISKDGQQATTTHTYSVLAPPEKEATQETTTEPTPVAQCVVPDLHGIAFSALGEALAAAHCALGAVHHAYNHNLGNGLVIYANPHHGSVLVESSKVNVWVSRGQRPAMCVVPSKLHGMSLKRAEKALRAADCKPGKIMRVPNKKVKKGHVIAVQPHHGRTRPAGTKIAIWVSKGRHHKP